MQCMKCGRDTELEQVFCDSCREVMARYPVRPGIVVQLPRRAVPTQEERNQILRRVVRWLAALVLLLTVAAVGLGWLSLRLYRESEFKVLPGQNYSAASTQETEKPTTSPIRNTDE